MGKYYFDQYSYLHFASGIVAYFWGLSLLQWMSGHLLFEWAENSDSGMYFINHYVWFWPGGKKSVDTVENIVGDNIAAFIGWISAYFIDCIATRQGLNIGLSCRSNNKKTNK